MNHPANEAELSMDQAVFIKPPKVYIAYKRLYLLLLSAIIIGLAVISSTIILVLTHIEPMILSTSIAFLMTLLFWIAMFIIFWPGLSHRSIGYRTGTIGIEIQKGIIWKQLILIPKSRIQHIDIVQGPLERRFQLAHLIIHTAGTMSAQVVLPGLEREKAFTVRSLLNTGSSPDDL